jgi:hypothetical protein
MIMINICSIMKSKNGDDSPLFSGAGSFLTVATHEINESSRS